VFQRGMLTETDREEISRGIVEGLEVQVIAARIGEVSAWCPGPGGRSAGPAPHEQSRCPDRRHDQHRCPTRRGRRPRPRSTGSSSGHI
jgi:hypothetical protein